MTTLGEDKEGDDAEGSAEDLGSGEDILDDLAASVEASLEAVSKALSGEGGGSGEEAGSEEEEDPIELVSNSEMT